MDIKGKAALRMTKICLSGKRGRMKLSMTVKGQSWRIDQVFEESLNVKFEMSIRSSNKNVNRYLDIVIC